MLQFKFFFDKKASWTTNLFWCGIMHVYTLHFWVAGLHHRQTEILPCSVWSAFCLHPRPIHLVSKSEGNQSYWLQHPTLQRPFHISLISSHSQQNRLMSAGYATAYLWDRKFPQAQDNLVIFVVICYNMSCHQAITITIMNGLDHKKHICGKNGLFSQINLWTAVLLW